jgi:hypothetical protein
MTQSIVFRELIPFSNPRAIGSLGHSRDSTRPINPTFFGTEESKVYDVPAILLKSQFFGLTFIAE